MLLVSLAAALQWEGLKRAGIGSDNHRLSQYLSLGVLSFSDCFKCEDPCLGEQWTGCLGWAAVFPHFILQGWVLLAAHPAAGQKRLEHGGLLGLCTVCATRMSPKPCWVSLGLSKAEPLLSDTITGEVGDLGIWKCLSCKNIPRNA